MNILSVKDNQKKPGQWSAHYFVMRHICLKAATRRPFLSLTNHLWSFPKFGFGGPFLVTQFLCTYRYEIKAKLSEKKWKNHLCFDWWCKEGKYQIAKVTFQLYSHQVSPTGKVVRLCYSYLKKITSIFILQSSYLKNIYPVKITRFFCNIILYAIIYFITVTKWF